MNREITKVAVCILVGVALLVGLWFVGKYCGEPRTIEKLTILEVEEKYDIEIYHPTVRDCQRHINRHGGLRGKFIAEDNINGPETIAGAKWLRNNQHASKWDFYYAGDSK